MTVRARLADAGAKFRRWAAMPAVTNGDRLAYGLAWSIAVCLSWPFHWDVVTTALIAGGSICMWDAASTLMGHLRPRLRELSARIAARVEEIEAQAEEKD